MSIKRYGFQYRGGNEYIWEGEQPNGEYCNYSHYEDLQTTHEQALAASQSRVTHLEAALNRIVHFGNDTQGRLFGMDARRMMEIAKEALGGDAGEGA